MQNKTEKSKNIEVNLSEEFKDKVKALQALCPNAIEESNETEANKVSEILERLLNTQAMNDYIKDTITDLEKNLKESTQQALRDNIDFNKQNDRMKSKYKQVLRKSENVITVYRDLGIAKFYQVCNDDCLAQKANYDGQEENDKQTILKLQQEYKALLNKKFQCFEESLKKALEEKFCEHQEAFKRQYNKKLDDKLDKINNSTKNAIQNLEYKKISNYKKKETKYKTRINDIAKELSGKNYTATDRFKGIKDSMGSKAWTGTIITSIIAGAMFAGLVGGALLGIGIPLLIGGCASKKYHTTKAAKKDRKKNLKNEIADIKDKLNKLKIKSDQFTKRLEKKDRDYLSSPVLSK